MKKRDIIILAIMMIIIVIGIILASTIGFKKQLRFSDSQKIDIFVGQKIDLNKVKDIANEAIGHKNMVQTIEIYGDMVTIRAQSISEEQKNTIINKIKEIYEFEQTAEDTKIENIPATRIRDILKKYILPFAISEFIILIYMMIRYYKKGVLKVIINTILIPSLLELVLLSILVITRIPIGIFTPSLILIVFVISMIIVINRTEKLKDRKI